jgi:hypothetical protein
MHYEKPMVMELNARARVTGQTPNACIAGLAASGDETCVDGVNAGFSCVPGVNPGGLGISCAPGTSPDDGFADCADGATAFYCTPGIGGSEDPEGCRSGPLPIPV